MLTVIRLELTRVPPTSVESQYTASPATKFVPLIVRANPLYKLAPDDVSPRLVELFNEVRKRTLPDVARQLYADGKSSFEAKNVGEANARFKKLLAVLGETDVRATPGVHHVSIRVNGGGWTAPPGLAAIDDDFAGQAGLLVVP